MVLLFSPPLLEECVMTTLDLGTAQLEMLSGQLHKRISQLHRKWVKLVNSTTTVGDIEEIAGETVEAMDLAMEVDKQLCSGE